MNVVKTNEWSPQWDDNGVRTGFNAMATYKSNPDLTDPQRKQQEGLVSYLRDSDIQGLPRFLHVYFVNSYEDGLGFAYGPDRNFRDGPLGAIFDRTVIIGRKGVDPADTTYPVDVTTLAHELGHLLRLNHVTEKKPDALTLTETESLRSKVQVMGNGQFFDPAVLAMTDVRGQRRFTEVEEKGNLAQTSLWHGVYGRFEQVDNNWVYKTPNIDEKIVKLVK